MSAAREKDQADFDLERFINMFDEAMTSQDPRVIETLRSLMMIVTLTRPESTDALNHRKGPLRRSFEDMNHMWKRMEQMEEELRQMHHRMSNELGRRGWQTAERAWPDYEEKFSLAAASQMAQHIDNDLVRKLTQKINSGGAIKGATGAVGASAKGLYKK